MNKISHLNKIYFRALRRVVCFSSCEEEMQSFSVVPAECVCVCVYLC